MDYREHLIVRPGHQVRLKAIDPGYRGQDESHEKAGPEIERYLAEMSALQVLLYAERKHALLIVLQGIDAAGCRRLQPVVLRGRAGGARS